MVLQSAAEACLCSVFFPSDTHREMPYADIEQQREAVRSWREAHPDRVRAYRKASMLKRTAQQRRLPRPSSIEHHALTNEEVLQLVKGVLASLA